MPSLALLPLEELRVEFLAQALDSVLGVVDSDGGGGDGGRETVKLVERDHGLLDLRS